MPNSCRIVTGGRPFYLWDASELRLKRAPRVCKQRYTGGNIRDHGYRDLGILAALGVFKINREMIGSRFYFTDITIGAAE